MSRPSHSIHLYPPQGSYQPLRRDVVSRPPSTSTTTTTTRGSTTGVRRRHRLTTAPPPSTESTSHPAEKIDEEHVARPRQRRRHVNAGQCLTETPGTGTCERLELAGSQRYTGLRDAQRHSATSDAAYESVPRCHDVAASTHIITEKDDYLQPTCGTRPASMSLVSLRRETSASSSYSITTPRASATLSRRHCDSTPSTSDVTLRISDVISTGSDDNNITETARQHLDTGTYLKLKRSRQPLDGYTALAAQRNSVVSSRSDAIYESIPRRDATTAPYAGHGDDDTASTYSRMDYLHPI